MNEFEIVSNDEASMEDYPEGFDTDPTSPGFVPPRPWDPDTETWDAFIARTRKIPVVRDGGFDTQVKR